MASLHQVVKRTSKQRFLAYAAHDRALGAEDDGFVSYGKFRDFLILLPQAKLVEQDPNIAWFEAATLVPFGARGTLPGRALVPGLASSEDGDGARFSFWRASRCSLKPAAEGACGSWAA